MKRRTSYLVLVSLACALTLALASGCSGRISTKHDAQSTAASVETSSAAPASAATPQTASNGSSASLPVADDGQASKMPDSDKVTSGQSTPAQRTPSNPSASKTTGTKNSSNVKTSSPTQSTTAQKTTQQSAPSGTSGSNSSTTASEKITVTVSVDCKTAVAAGYEQATSISSSGSLAHKTVTLPKGSSAFDALKATGLSVGSESTSMGTYVYSIASLREKECGSMSGWLYLVNGRTLSKSCDSAILQSGDSVSWRYTCNGGKDI